MQIIYFRASDDCEYLQTLQTWFENEWGEVDPPLSPDYPSPVLAVSGSSLIGGISFTQAEYPTGEAKETWINALYVDPAFRRMGVARSLIREAEHSARLFSLETLFVFTEYPDLYADLGWEQLADMPNVLQKEIWGN